PVSTNVRANSSLFSANALRIASRSCRSTTSRGSAASTPSSAYATRRSAARNRCTLHLRRSRERKRGDRGAREQREHEVPRDPVARRPREDGGGERLVRQERREQHAD